MTKHTIDGLFNSFSGISALVIGDVMIDAYVWGRVDRISPEAPVPVVHIHNRENRLGGAANVALNIKSLGGRAIICSVVGDGPNGDLFRKTLKENGFSTEGVIDSDDRMTTVKTRIIAAGHHIVRLDDEMTTPLNATDERNLLESISIVLSKQKIDVIILEDYNKGVLTDRVIRQVIAWAREKNIPTAIDPKEENFFSYEHSTLFKPNLKELREGLKLNIDKNNLDDISNADKILRERLHNVISLVTLSEMGIYVSDKSGIKHLPAHEREIVDVSGAGDTVISVAALCLAAGADPQTIAFISNLAGGIVCESTGVVPIDREKLLDEARTYLAD